MKGSVNLHLEEVNQLGDVKSTRLKRMEFDEVLPLVGEYGPYQVILFFLLLPFCFFIAFIYMSQMFITLVPDNYTCSLPMEDPLAEQYNLTVEDM